jgi:hypothetical protein
LRFVVDPSPDGMDITLNGRTLRLAEPRLSRGWQLLVGVDAPWLDVLWLLALFMPTGLFASNLRGIVLGGATLLGLLLVLPFFTWTAPTSAWAVLLGVLGLSGGWMFRHLLSCEPGGGRVGRTGPGGLAGPAPRKGDGEMVGDDGDDSS